MTMEKHNDYKELAFVCRAWWRGLQSLDKDGKSILIGSAEKPRNRAALANLRRINEIEGGGAVDIGAALGTPAFRDLIRRLRTSLAEGKFSNRRVADWLSGDDPEMAPFTIAAAALARVRDDSGNKKDTCGATARLLGAARSEGGDKDDHLFAEARFKQLIRTRDDWPGLMRQARRIAAILEREAPVGDLGASLILWNAGSNDPADRKTPNIIRAWAFQYYQRDFEPVELPDEPQSSATPANT